MDIGIADNLQQLLSHLTDYVNNNPLFWIWMFLASILCLAIFLLLMPLIAARIPENYFNTPPKKRPAPTNWITYLVCKVVRNIFGVILLLLGLLLLLTPAQGILFILAASFLLDYPGKFRFQKWLTSKKPIRKSLNWFRKKGGAEPLIFDK